MVNFSLFLTENLGHESNPNTNILCKESLLRGYKTLTFTPRDIFISESKVYAYANPVSLSKSGDLICSDKKQKVDLADNNIIQLRLDPPFNTNYYTAMKFLEYAEVGSLVVNKPASIISWAEKLVPNELLKFCPKTLISSNFDDIISFWEENKDIIIKPLYEFAGRSVFRLKKGDENYKSILQVIGEMYDQPLIAQEYLPEVKKGDKRITFLDGEFFGAFNRIAPEGQLQAAMARGGSITPHELTKNEKEICKILKPLLKRDGIFFCGIDVIGDHLTEINVTCPAAFIGLNKLYNNNSEKLYWDKLEEKTK